MRTKVALIIIAMTFIIVVFSLGSNLIVTRNVLFDAIGRDSAASAAMADGAFANAFAYLAALSALLLAIGAAAAYFLSAVFAKPYEKIAEQNRTLERLNEVSASQADVIREVHQRTMLMSDAVPICSMLWDENGNIFDCNEESVRMFGAKDKQDFIERFFEFSPKFQPGGRLSHEKAEEYIKGAFDDGRTTFDWMHQLSDGTQIPCLMTLVRVECGDRQIVAAYAQDQREIKKMMAEAQRLQSEIKSALKEAMQANSAKSGFLARMSHEMRTPLNAVVGLSELMLSGSEMAEDVEEKLNKIHMSGMMLLGIVNDILDLSKIESGKFEMHPVEYDTPSMINDIASLNVTRIGEKRISFNLLVDENLPAMLVGDDLRVKQIFNNLLSNAFKYTHSGVVEWSVSHERDRDGVWLVSHVKDSGVGIKREDIGKLFSDYNMLDAEANRKTEGTGLGLAITKNLAEMMGGTITVESVYGIGTVFKVRLRQKHVSDAPIGRITAENLMSARFTDVKRHRGANIARVDLSYAKILVVDDVKTNHDVIKGMLKLYNASVDCAMSGYQALEALRGTKNRYDAIFMDHMMSGMDGLETTRIIREEIERDAEKKTPIIALTANAIAGNEKMFLENGFQAFISKPIDMMRLDSVLRQFVRDKEREKRSDFRIAEAPPDGDDDEFGYSGVTADKLDEAARRYNLASLGMDIDGGVRRFAGDVDSYLTVLHSYEVNTRPILDDMERHLADGSMSEYAIAVHGIKGSSLGIGAVRAGKEAEFLEHRAKAGDFELINVKNTGFVLSMHLLLDTLRETLTYLALEMEKNAKGKEIYAYGADEREMLKLIVS